jgi:uncharacterized cupredoxin-like copper-binding protein
MAGLEQTDQRMELCRLSFCSSIPFFMKQLNWMPWSWQNTLVRVSLGFLVGLVLWLNAVGMPGIAFATTDLVSQAAIAVTVSLGTATNELTFVPKHLEFVAGKRYTLTLSNPSALKHYFTAKDFADAIWTQNVKAGNVEVKGAIHDLELKPGAQAIWTFIPIKSGSYELHCSVPGHAAAGMVGKLTISAAL